MATIEKLQRASGTVYKAKVRKQGHPTVTRTFKTRSAAERWARKFEASIEEDNAGLVSEGQKHTLADAIARYRREILPTRNASTIPNYTRHLLHWETTLGHLRLSELTPARIAGCRDDLSTTPIPSKRPDAEPSPLSYRSPSTVNRYLATLAAVLTACVKRWHWLKDSPMRQVDKPSEDNARTRFLSKDELQRLLAACRESRSPDLYLAVLLAITTGARQGEILGLRWRDVDLDRGLLHLRVDNETATKGGVRSLPIAAQLLPLFKDRLAELEAESGLDTPKQEARIQSALVFPGRISANTPIYLRRSFENALMRAGIEDFRWHDLRHSAASFFAANGASLLEIGAVLGHKTAQTTKRYAHLTEQATHALVRGTADKLLGGDP